MRKTKFNNNKYLIPTFFLALSLVSVASGIFLPDIFLSNNAKSRDGQVQIAPDSYYNTQLSALSVRASESLPTLDRIKLISGAWENSVQEISFDNISITSYEAAELAKEKIAFLYNCNAYPSDLSSSVDNWYSWTATAYQYTDITFNTYTTNAILLEFSKYDSTEKHTILMTENGSILEAVAKNIQYDNYLNILTAYTNTNISSTLSQGNISISKTSTTNTLNNDYLYDSIDVRGPGKNPRIYDITLSTNTGTPENFTIYQYEYFGVYGIGIIPQ